MLDLQDALNRRTFLQHSASGLGIAALGSMLPGSASAGSSGFNHSPKAKRIIYMFQSGAPSQMDLFDPKPGLAKHHGQDLPDSIRQGQRLTGMTSKQSSFPVAPSKFKFKRCGKAGIWMSELVPFMQ